MSSCTAQTSYTRCASDFNHRKGLALRQRHRRTDLPLQQAQNCKANKMLSRSKRFRLAILKL